MTNNYVANIQIPYAHAEFIEEYSQYINEEEVIKINKFGFLEVSFDSEQFGIKLDKIWDFVDISNQALYTIKNNSWELEKILSTIDNYMINNCFHIVDLYSPFIDDLIEDTIDPTGYFGTEGEAIFQLSNWLSRFYKDHPDGKIYTYSYNDKRSDIPLSLKESFKGFVYGYLLDNEEDDDDAIIEVDLIKNKEEFSLLLVDKNKDVTQLTIIKNT